VARIRSIKPEFFTSEVVASLPISARLTFIGLWTHVDDNGVTVDNPKLITAALWPLEDDPREALARVSGDLANLSTAGLIARYQVSGRRYLFVVGWDEHQRVSHPSKPRYPRPDKLPTSENTDQGQASGEPPENLQRAPESLVPEQGAGSREQGARNREEEAPQAAPPATKKRGTRLPDDFTVTDDMRAWFNTNCPGINGQRETEKFRNYFQAAPGQKGVKVDWPATWRNWMLNAAERGTGPATARTTGANRHTDHGRPNQNPFRTGEATATYASQTAGGTR